jgi:hypothetical protein
MILPSLFQSMASDITDAGEDEQHEIQAGLRLFYLAGESTEAAQAAGGEKKDRHPALELVRDKHVCVVRRLLAGRKPDCPGPPGAVKGP